MTPKAGLEAITSTLPRIVFVYAHGVKDQEESDKNTYVLLIIN